MPKPFSLLCAVVFPFGLCLEHAASAIEPPNVKLPPEASKEPGAPQGQTDAFALGYRLAEKTVSPNGKYGVFYADLELFGGDEDAVANYVVEVKPLRVVGRIECEPYFAHRNHGALRASWAKDSSAVLVTSDGKWSPRNIVLVELRDGRIARQHQLMDDVFKALEADYKKCDPDDFMEQSFHGQWEIDGKLRVVVRGDSESNGKRIPGRKSWEGRFRGLWSIAQAKWIEKNVSRLFCGTYKGEQ